MSSSTQPLMKAIRKLFKRRATARVYEEKRTSIDRSSSATMTHMSTEAVDYTTGIRHLDEHIYEEICLEPRHSCTESLFNTRLNQFHRLLHQRSSTEEQIPQARVTESRDASTQCDGTCLPTTDDSQARFHSQVVMNRCDQVESDSVPRHCDTIRDESDYVQYNPPDSVSHHQSYSHQSNSSETTQSGTLTDSGCCGSFIQQCQNYQLIMERLAVDQGQTFHSMPSSAIPVPSANRSRTSRGSHTRTGELKTGYCQDCGYLHTVSSIGKVPHQKNGILPSIDVSTTRESLEQGIDQAQQRRRIEKWLVDVQMQHAIDTVHKYRRRRRRHRRNRWILQQSSTMFEVVI